MDVQQEIVLCPTQGESLAFHGRVIAFAEGDASDKALRGRKHVVTIYECDDCWLHARIDFVSTCSSEESVTTVDARLGVDDVEAVLALYDPLRHVSNQQMQRMHCTDATLFKKALWHEFDLLSIEILKQMNGFTPSVPAPRADQAHSRWTSWIPFVH